MIRYLSSLLFALTLICAGHFAVFAQNVTNRNVCEFDPVLLKEIASYENVVRKIVDYVLDGPFKNKTYNDLADFVDEYGPRMSGSAALEKSIDFVLNKSISYGLNIFTENVEVPYWVRGEESAAMLEPRYLVIPILGLGSSVSTPPEGITAEAVVVSDFEELNNLSSEYVSGKIVIYNQPYTYYGGSAKYRRLGASIASLKGAVAVLVRSVTQFSLGTLHAGNVHYQNNSKPIPAASITSEDANLLRRIYKRGKKIVIKLKMFSTQTEAISRNTIIDITGSKQPEKYVIVSGHIDSWDIGQGAMDDGGGLFISWAVPIILKELNIDRPRRTLRTILWTAEEFDTAGAYSYIKEHQDELQNINFVLESDEGTFNPKGLEVRGNHEVICVLSEVLKLFDFINITTIKEVPTPGSDIILFLKLGIPGAGLMNENERYFWYHHSHGDSMDILDPKSLDLATAFWTAISYIIADISFDMPRENKKS